MRITSYRRLSALAVATAVAISGGPAGAAEITDFTVAAPGGPGKSWLDMLRQVFPDLAPAPAPKTGGTASGTIALRSIGVANDSWSGCGDPISITGLDGQTVRLAGADRLIVTFAIDDDCAAPLALFAADDGRLLDAVNVKADQHTYFPEDHVRPLGPGGALVIVGNGHHNSNEDWGDLMLVLAAADRLAAIGDLGALSQWNCRRQTLQSATIRTAPDRAPFARVNAETTMKSQKLAGDCKTPTGNPVVKTSRKSWRWNATKAAYVADRH